MFIKKLENIFIILAAIFGLIFLFATPYNGVADEETHMMRSCEVADGIFYNFKNSQPPKAEKCDSFIQKDLYLRRPESNFHNTSGYSPVLYTFSSIGLNIGKHWNNGIVMFYLARLLNLIVWITLTALAIKITPVFKYPFFFTALLPMNIFEGMSLSADSLNNGFTFLFFAYIFKLIYEKTELSKKSLSILSLMSIFSAFLKGAIYPVFLFFFLPIKRHKALFCSLCIIITLAVMFLVSANAPVFTNPDPNCNVEYNKFLLTHNPLDFLYKFAVRIATGIPWYTASCIGILGWLNINLSGIYIITVLVFLGQFIVFPEKKITDIQRITAFIIFAGYTTLMHIYYYIIWNAPAYHKILGIQGRYFIPLLPLLFISFTRNKTGVSATFQKNYKIFIIIYTTIILIYSSFVLLKHYQYPFTEFIYKIML